MRDDLATLLSYVFYGSLAWALVCGVTYVLERRSECRKAHGRLKSFMPERVALGPAPEDDPEGVIAYQEEDVEGYVNLPTTDLESESEDVIRHLRSFNRPGTVFVFVPLPSITLADLETEPSKPRP